MGKLKRVWTEQAKLFCRIVFFCILLCSLNPFQISAATAKFRGIWVDGFGPGFLNQLEVQKLAADCRKYNFNAVFVEMRKRGDAFYVPHEPNNEPRSSLVASNFDALQAIIDECHNGTPRIEVHCWFVSHFIWSGTNDPPASNHVFNAHPEWLTKDSIGQKHLENGWFLDPGNPDANRWVHDVALDIATHYDIDGFHWDYCRYPSQDSGYNEASLKRFKKETGSKDDPSPSDTLFSEWRRRQVTDFLRSVNADLWSAKPSLVISASVFANRKDSTEYRFADWAAWNREGIIDLCIPMDFSSDNTAVYIPRAKDALLNQGIRRIYLGQGGYKNSPEATVGQLKAALALGFEGAVFYDYRHPNAGKLNPDETFALIKERLQPTWCDTPTLPWKKTTCALKDSVTSSVGPLYDARVNQ